MKQPMYIEAATAISAQNSFDRTQFLRPAINTDSGRLYALDAPYGDYINPVAIRRMSRINKITISAAMQCLREAGVAQPDAIITGTGRGGVTDMEMFVKDMIRLGEDALNPTAFIQSTYNSPNGWIAMLSKSNCYNQTYVHRGCSFELALVDAQMLLRESSETQYLLAGCFDEMTEDYYHIRKARHYWKKERINSLELLSHADTTGTIGGEGASFFVLTNKPVKAKSCISDLDILHDADSETVLSAAREMLSRNNLDLSGLSAVMTGLNGDVITSALYTNLLVAVPEHVGIGSYKQFCGDFDTAFGFGLWLSDYLFRDIDICNEVIKGSLKLQEVRNVLLVNHFLSGTTSIALLSAV